MPSSCNGSDFVATVKIGDCFTLNWNPMWFPKAKIKAHKNTQITTLSFVTNPVYHSKPQIYTKKLSHHIYRKARLSEYRSNTFSDKPLNNTQIQEMVNTFKDEINHNKFPSNSCYKNYAKLFNDFVTNSVNYKANTIKCIKCIKTNHKNTIINPCTDKNDIKNDDNDTCDEQKFYNDLAHDISADMDKNFNIKIDINDSLKLKSSINYKKEKILLMIDYDDTLIPSTIIKIKDYSFTHKNLNKKECKYLQKYIVSLHKFIDKILYLFDNNKYKNIIIVTNASSMWVRKESLFGNGLLWANMMKSFHEKITNAKIDIFSAFDYWQSDPLSFRKVNADKWKYVLMEWIYYDYFGKKLPPFFKQDIKIISIGDSIMEFNGSKVALLKYLQRQDMSILRNINLSLFRIKMVDQPKSFNMLHKQLNWCYKNIENIVKNESKSKDYFLQKILKL